MPINPNEELTPETSQEAFTARTYDPMQPVPEEAETNMEAYIKYLYDKTQRLPEKPDTREEYFMMIAGQNIGPGSEVEPLRVTENGIYSEAGKAYSPVTVEVPLGTKSITNNGTYNASSDELAGYSSVTVAVDGFKRKSIANTPTDIASFNDGTANPMPSLEISIEPQQDLHGYDYPWVGGAGKNKCPINSGTITVGDFVTFDTPLPSGTYSFSLKATRTPSSNSYASLVLYDKDGVAYTNVIGIDPSQLDGRVVKVEAKELNNGISKIYAYSIAENWSDSRNYTLSISDLQIEQGSTATSFAPYSNICPISGHTEADVTVADDLTTPTETHTTSIPFHDSSDNPITVYGGTLNVTSGVLTVDKAYVDLGTLNYSYYSGNLFTVQISNLKPVPNEVICDALCSIYVAKKGNEYSSIDGSFVAGFNNSPVLAIHDSRFTDATAFKQAMNGVQLVYKLDTPQTYQLTPTQVATLLGQNNIFADCGQMLDGEYFVAL